MRSLRRRLVVSLWLVVTTIGGVSALFAYQEAKDQAKSLLDDQLEQIAGFVVARTAEPVPGRDSDETIQVAVWDSDGRPTYSTTPLLQKPASSRMRFSQITLNGEPYRLFTGLMNGRLVAVAQPMDTRDDIAEGAAITALFPLAILLPILGIVIALVIRTLLQPVREAAAVVSRRDALDVGSLQTAGLPAEILPLVEEINRLLDRQREAVEQQQQFIADAAHALRTPLAALQLQADVLRDAKTDEQRSSRFTELRDGIHRTSRLASQLLSIARSASAAPHENFTELDSACKLVLENLKPLARAKDVEVVIVGTQDLRCVGSTDQIAVVLGNLVDNAIRYTDAGSKVFVSIGQVAASVVVSIEDHGPGLPEQELQRVFSRFYRAPGDRTEGSGLGLSIVESIVRNLGGSIALKNRVGGGLCATLHLPLVSGVGPASA